MGSWDCAPVGPGANPLIREIRRQRSLKLEGLFIFSRSFLTYMLYHILAMAYEYFTPLKFAYILFNVAQVGF